MTPTTTARITAAVAALTEARALVNPAAPSVADLNLIRAEVETLWAYGYQLVTRQDRERADELSVAALVRQAAGGPTFPTLTDGESDDVIRYYSGFELDDFFRRHGGTITAKVVTRRDSSGASEYQVVEVSVDTDLLNIDTAVRAFTDVHPTDGPEMLALSVTLDPSVMRALDSLPALAQI